MRRMPTRPVDSAARAPRTWSALALPAGLLLAGALAGAVPARALDAGIPSIGACQVFPANNIWNTRVDRLPVHARSAEWVDSIGRTTGFHMDFGSGTWDGGPIGIPYNLANAATPTYTLAFDYADESDPGPYPIPDSPLVEHGSDHHLLVVETSTCRLHEIYHAALAGGVWSGGSGAAWDLGSNALRPAGWTSADAAGLPILPGLARYDEVAAGEINHALRFTAANTNGYVWPARHLTSDNPASPQVPPMGARFRLKGSYDTTGFPATIQVLLRAMKTYGIILADNGSNWYVGGVPDERWNNDDLHLLDVLTGGDFEAVDSSGLMTDPDSGATGPAFSVTANASGTGFGRVTSNVGGIAYNYPATRTAVTSLLGQGARVTLTAAGNAGTSAAWPGCAAAGGAASGNGTARATCTFAALDADKIVGATFTRTGALARFVSVGTHDGQVLESSETSSRGGALNASYATFRVGDDASDRQYRAILSFNTATLPDHAVVTSAKLRLRHQASVGTNPFTTHGNIVVDVKLGAFSGSSALQAADFQAVPSRPAAATIRNALLGGWYSTALPPACVNRVGLTQLRLRFARDDDDDRRADFLSIYSGNAGASVRPALEVVYYVP